MVLSFEPLLSRPLRVVTMEVLFLLSLATTKHVEELQAIARHVAFQGHNLSLAYLPKFVTKMQSERNLIPLSFLVRSLEQFVDDLPEERLLCPVRAVHIYLDLTSPLSQHLRSLFVLSRASSCALSKNALSFFLRQVIVDADAL